MSAWPFTWPGCQPDNAIHQTITAYLTIDIQKSREAAGELLEKIDAVSSGKIPNWERTGNAYCLRIFPDYAVIEEDYAAEPGNRIRIPAALLKTAAQAWLHHIAH